MNSTLIFLNATRDLAINLAITLVVAVVIAAVLSLFKSRDDTANTWKARTVVFIALAVLALFVPQIWIVMTPLYLVLAYRSYKAGRADASHPAGVVSAGKPVCRVILAAVVGIIAGPFIDAFTREQVKTEEYGYDINGRPYSFPQPDQWLNASDTW